MSDLGNKQIFAKNFQHYMDINHKSRLDISKDLDIPYTTITSWLKGEFYPRIDKIELIANYFEIKKSDLVEEKISSNAIPLPDIPIKVPVICKISAGLPILAVENIEGYEFAPSSYIKEGFEYFYLRVSGDSMNLKFNNGDLVLVQKQEDLDNNEIGVILVNGFDATVKKFKRENGVVILEPMSTNKDHEVQTYNPKETPIKIIGKVISYQGKL